MDLNEFRTRTEKIDVLLKEEGWNVKDRTKVLVEVDTKQSDFKKRDYKFVSETLKNDLESKYCDYLLYMKFIRYIHTNTKENYYEYSTYPETAKKNNPRN